MATWSTFLPRISRKSILQVTKLNFNEKSFSIVCKITKNSKSFSDIHPNTLNSKGMYDVTLKGFYKDLINITTILF